MTVPSPADLETTFRHIAETRMAGLPVLNPALEVETVGFRTWREGSIGVLITPWFMNLICLPGPDADETAPTLDFPCGTIEFMTVHEEHIGNYLSCSLFSPMERFTDMSAAREVAEAVMAELFVPAPADFVPDGLSDRLTQPLSRRGFLSAFAPREPGP